MKKIEREQKKKEALKLYLSGLAKDDIAKRLGTAGSTIDKWDKKGNWKELYNQTSQKITEKTIDSVALEKERSLKLIKGAEAIIAQKIQSGEIEGVSIPALAQLQRVKWEILSPKKEIELTTKGEGIKLIIHEKNEK